MERKIILVNRECPARLVPDGTPITIKKDTFVTLTQSLGGAYTVLINGNMARVDGTDGDALGFEPIVLVFELSEEKSGDDSDDQSGNNSDNNTVLESNVWKAISAVYDPEMPVNIVDLGLIYDCKIDGHTVVITMTLTAPACGMGPVLVEDVKYKVGLVPNVDTVNVILVLDPPWSREMMTEEAQLELGLF
ncbi:MULTISPECIES: putative Fe-S cluster assembly protein SufT [unclassified Colwellia]|uniref:putative Fe-S cluster assembly protein SufT n=1 Tax=unclassified Colwellia TaxID=196834 RepID=UPI0015F4BD5B|nr:MULTISPECIES: putative Fe-S cluster assembly protein SufT [unclassified Colwellia]MBA6232741.1 putative Fe-S cluster assembly protein SufT [Colwellia sp. MB02u-7]MBA6236171.1 putative Fe-S cluster assembly protein SufT [Colwellia sp. MB02u-11]MBA6256577.1 putative Fe-S cluster assembly protein SufT [Colwellia sp. MB3u-28]MBA6261292.1 putative Fe-S cluster assembly protein SufT [Colwellia sp. MB3u-41]MBA6298429.1 putative Fe-S cluster assembly protein SufT [Colwellia sp. MB3u-22]